MTDTDQATEPGQQPQARRKRRPHRRDQILAAATKLFHANGYHATGMDEIGAAAGITGPAIYRHFKSKEDILEKLILDHSQTALEQAHEIVEGAADATEALQGLVRLYVVALLDNPALAHLGLLERRTLSDEVRRTLERSERLHLEEWVHALVQVRPELTDTEARVMVHAVNGLGTMAAIYRSGLPREMLEPLLLGMVMNALLAEPPAWATDHTVT